MLVTAALLSAVYSMLVIFRWKHIYRKKEKPTEITGQREIIEDKVYDLNFRLFNDMDSLFDSNHLVLEFPQKDLSVSHSIPNYSFFENLGLNMENVEIQEKTVLCIMPFNKRFDKIYAAIKSACGESGFSCVRSDEPTQPGNILRQILQLILHSELIVAVLDGKNPNVFYEIGIAHSLGKTVILVGNMANPEDVSFNLKSERLLLYSSHSDLKQKLVHNLNNLKHVQ